jgi:hypothetical protein
LANPLPLTCVISLHCLVPLPQKSVTYYLNGLISNKLGNFSWFFNLHLFLLFFADLLLILVASDIRINPKSIQKICLRCFTKIMRETFFSTITQTKPFSRERKQYQCSYKFFISFNLGSTTKTIWMSPKIAWRQLWTTPKSAVLKPGVAKCPHRAGVHNIRPAGQIWLAEVLYLALKAHNSAYLAWLFPKNIL